MTTKTYRPDMVTAMQACDDGEKHDVVLVLDGRVVMHVVDVVHEVTSREPRLAPLYLDHYRLRVGGLEVGLTQKREESVQEPEGDGSDETKPV